MVVSYSERQAGREVNEKLKGGKSVRIIGRENIKNQMNLIRENKLPYQIEL